MRKMKYVENFDSLESALSNMNCIKPFNIYIGVPGDEKEDKFLDKRVVVSDYAFSILIDPDFYCQYKNDIEKYFYRNAEIRKNKILENIKNNSISDEDSIYLSIDKYHYDEDFIRSIINLNDDKNIVLSFFGVKPSNELLFLFKKNKVNVYLYNRDAKSVKISDRWFTKEDFKNWEENESYEVIPYDKLVDNLDCLEKLSLLDSFSITNISDSILYSVNIGKPRKTEYKMEINSVYLENVFHIVKKLRDYGYDKPINIQCDGLYDISKSLFNYDSLGVNFGSAELDLKYINMLFNRYRSIAREALINGDMSLSEKLNYIYIVLADIVNSEEGKRKELDMKFFRNEIFSHTYDLCKLFGLNPIKCPNTTNFYFFERHDPNVVKFNPIAMKYCFDMGNIDITDVNIEKRAWDAVYSAYNKIDDKNSSSFEKYLRANSVEEIKEVFLDSIDLSDNLYVDVKERYIDELNYLVNILMDLSEDDYLEYKESTYSFNSITDVINACEKIAGLILENKKKQIGIVMTKREKVNVSKNKKVRV